jgi:hypothetical protein
VLEPRTNFNCSGQEKGVPVDQVSSVISAGASLILVGGWRTHRISQGLFAYPSLSVDAKSVTTAVMGREVKSGVGGVGRGFRHFHVPRIQEKAMKAFEGVDVPVRQVWR